MRHHQRYFKANHWGIQLEPVFLSAHIHIHTCTHMHFYTPLNVVLFLQTVFKDSETELIVLPLQRLCSFI